MTSRILVQTTIPRRQDDWHVGRFRFLVDHLGKLTDSGGRPRFDVLARDREPSNGGDDPFLCGLTLADMDQVWVLGVDAGDDSGLTPREVESLSRFYQAGGALMLTRDHQDMGCALSTVGDVGAAHCWHNVAPEDDPERRTRDDDNPSIDWPNYHSGRNGAFQAIERVAVDHPLLEGVHHLPAHPHEGALREPAEGGAGRAVARGTSRRSGRPFLLAVAFDHGGGEGQPARRAVAQSTFHHFADYNLDLGAGAPSFVDDPEALPEERGGVGVSETRRYWENLATWLSGRS